MTELKTLKDIEVSGFQLGHEKIVCVNDLKQEAIKWYKYLDEQVTSYTEETDIIQIVGAHDFIMKFFDLTEEDLQEKEK